MGMGPNMPIPLPVSCSCLLRVQGLHQWRPECTYRAHQSPDPNHVWELGPGLLHPKVLLNPWCCCQSLPRSCWGTAGPAAPQAEPLPPPVPQTPGLQISLSGGAIQVCPGRAQGSSRTNCSGHCFQTLGGACNIAIRLRAFCSRRTRVCVMAGELRALLVDPIPGDTAAVSTPLTSPHTSPLQRSIFKPASRYLKTHSPCTY